MKGELKVRIVKRLKAEARGPVNLMKGELKVAEDAQSSVHERDKNLMKGELKGDI